MDPRIIQLLQAIYDKQTTINFVAKWQARIVSAINVAGTWTYQISDRFIAVNEVAFTHGASYGLDHCDPQTAARMLHGSTATMLLPAYNGVNLDLSDMVNPAGNFTKHFFFTQAEKDAGTDLAGTTSDVKEGDSVMILVPQS